MNDRLTAQRKRAESDGASSFATGSSVPNARAQSSQKPHDALGSWSALDRQRPPGPFSPPLTVSQPGDPLEREADTVARQVVAGAAQPTISRASAPVPEAESEAIARTHDSATPQRGEVPAIVEDVLQTDGQPLSDSVRAAMEPRFGHRFSDVRVHTGAAAAESARSLDALAYTVGNDIVFGQEGFAPETAEGSQLIAHELTHVVQQSALPEGGQAARMVQRAAKLIPMPGWGNTILSDNSNMWFNPHADLIVGGGVADFTWFPRAAADGNEEVLRVAKGTTEGTVRLYIHMGWFKNIWSGNQSGKADAIIDAPFKVSPEGKLEWQGTRVMASNEGAGAQLVMPVPAATVGDTLTASPTINGVGSVGDSSQSTINISPGGLGGSKAEGRTVTSPQGVSSSRAYSVKLVVEPPDAPTIEQRVEEVRFAPASAKITEGGELKIVNFYKALPPHVQQSVEAGTLQMRLDGHASTTQPGSANRILSRDRALKVKEILADIAGSNAKFELHALGEYYAGTPDQVEDETERRVDIMISFPKNPPPGTAPAPPGGAPAPPGTTKP